MDPPSAPVAEAAPPVVIVHQSGHGWLTATLPPSLILLGALAITSHQLRPDPRAYAPASGPEKPATVVQVNPTAEMAQPKVEVHAAVPEPVTTAPAETPAPANEMAKVWGIPNEMALALVPPVPVAQPPAEPEAAEPPLVAEAAPDAAESLPEPLKPDDRGAEIIWNDIEAEAEANRREKERGEALRGEAFAKNQAETLAKLERARLSASNNRDEFIQELSTLLRKHGRKAGPFIGELLVLTGRDAPAELMERAEALNRRLVEARVPVEQRIKALRRIGLPETCILDGLARQLQPSIGTRLGPRNGQEVLYHAAMRLVKVPLDTPTPPEPAFSAANP